MIEHLRAELLRLDRKKANARDRYQEAVEDFDRAHERLKREIIRAEILAEQAEAMEQV